MAELIIMDRTGDSRMSFTPGDAPATQAAMDRFKELLGQGHIAYKEGADGQKTLTRTFDPDAERITLHPQLIGG